MYTAPGVAWLAQLDREPSLDERQRITAAENWAMSPAADSLEAFKKLITKLAVPFDTWRYLARRALRVDSQVKAAFKGWPLLGTSIVGSAVRNTVVRPVRDVDLMIVFQQTPGIGLTTMTPEGFLMWVRDQLQGIAPAAEVWSGECIRLKFASPPDIDIFAGYTLGQGGVVYFPRAGKTWYRTNPVAVDQNVIEANKRLNGQLLPLLLLLKCWNEYAGHHCFSFHLELLAARFYRSLGKPPPVHIYEFLAVAKEAGVGFLSISTPCGFVTDISETMAPSDRQAMVEAFRAGADISGRGLRAMMAGDHRAAVQQWARLFGPSFPRLEVP